MKKWIAQGFITIVLFAVMLPMRVFAESGDSFQVDRTGKVTLTSDHAAAEGVSSLQFSIKVEAQDADVSFEFYSNKAQITGSYYNETDNTLNVYMAGTTALFTSGYLEVGRVVVQDGSGSSAPATVSFGANPLQYVYGSELKDMEGVEGNTVVINSSSSTPGVTPPQTPADPPQTPVTDPPQTPADPTQTPVTNPTQTPTNPTQTPADPTQTPPTEPTQTPPTEPTQTPADPSQTPPEQTQAPVQPQPTDSQGNQNGSQAGDNNSQGNNGGSQGGSGNFQGTGGSSHGSGSTSSQGTAATSKPVASVSQGSSIKPQGTTGSAEKEDDASEVDNSEVDSSEEESADPDEITEGDILLETGGSAREPSSESASEPEKADEKKGVDWIFASAVAAVAVFCLVAGTGIMVLRKKPGESKDRDKK